MDIISGNSYNLPVTFSLKWPMQLVSYNIKTTIEQIFPCIIDIVYDMSL
jgi:hypothetical protein